MIWALGFSTKDSIIMINCYFLIILLHGGSKYHIPWIIQIENKYTVESIPFLLSH